MLNEFAELRAENILELKAMNIDNEKLELTGTHPELGLVTLKNLLACWTAHDLSHINQLSRVMAKNYKSEVGIWTNYLTILQSERV